MFSLAVSSRFSHGSCTQAIFKKPNHTENYYLQQCVCRHDSSPAACMFWKLVELACVTEQRNLKWHHKAVPRCSMTQMLHLQMKPNKNCDGKLWWDVQSLRVIAREFVLPVLHKPSIHGTIWDDWYTTNCKVEAPHIEAWDLPVQNRGCIPGRCTYSLAWYARKQNRLGLMLRLKKVLQDSRILRGCIWSTDRCSWKQMKLMSEPMKPESCWCLGFSIQIASKRNESRMH